MGIFAVITAAMVFQLEQVGARTVFPLRMHPHRFPESRRSTDALCPFAFIENLRHVEWAISG